ncbi:MAG: hypothetical protein PHH40_03465 [Candidatus Moranbacteria bacterium]|nr:hypothetical protein [Candidatus Moranbacteria bacterium]MDD3964694.1 hypothetical protein [Candidatus Moranbacteria bacterium]
MSLENPFSQKTILPPEETNPESNIKLIKAFLGTDSAEAYRKTLSGETTKPQKKPDFHLDNFDEKAFDTHEIENRLNIKKQYETQRTIFEKIGLLETKEGMLGMTDIEGVWHNFPILEEIQKRLKEKQTLVETKANQGFEKLLIVPFGMSIEKFTETMKKTLLAHYVSIPDPIDPEKRIPDPSKTKLWSKNEDGTMEALKLDYRNPFSWDEGNRTLVYFPTSFTRKNHGGKTKNELLGEGQAFHILLLESEMDIPSEGKGKEQGGRKKLEANKTPHEYLEQIQKNEAYQGEQGMTPETWMTLFLLHLETTNQVLDNDPAGGGSEKNTYNLGFWIPDSGWVLLGSWNRASGRAFLNRDLPNNHGIYRGCRSAVRV